MEKQLFDWTGWDKQDTAAFTFYKPVLKVPMVFGQLDLNLAMPI